MKADDIIAMVAALLVATAVARATAGQAKPTEWNAPAGGRSAAMDSTGALWKMNLASATDWTLAIDEGPARGIKVPGGGFNSDQQDPPWIEMCGDGHGQRMVKDHVTYQRTITIPRSAEGKVVLLEFGAVNHGAEIYLVDGNKETLIATHIGPHMPFAADLTRHVVAGKDYLVRVKAYPMWHYHNTVPNGFIYQEGWTKPTNGWASKFSFGIARYVQLAVYPEVRICDLFVRPSVAKSELECDVWLENHSEMDHTVTLRPRLTAWNKTAWKYPAIPEVTATVPAHSKLKVTAGPVHWTLGKGSYWWPNKPFREDYTPQLHNLEWSVLEKRQTLQTLKRRFGFVEWTEGPYYYCVNGVRVNLISDATPEAAMSEYDGYSTSPAFLPPTGLRSGCPETWKRYMRLGICANRIHQSTPTEYMMDAADETGFMLIPETAIRGYQKQKWNEQNFTRAPKELAEACRNHPSVCFYSLQNEENPAWVGPLADAMVTADDTRPLVFEDSWQNHPGAVFGRSGAHAYAMLHYQPAPTNSTSVIAGMGECAWNGGADQRTNAPFLEKFAFEVLQGRCANWAYYSGWDWLNYWPNFLEGMSGAKHVWKQQYHEDRKSKIDGWDSPVIGWVQKVFSPWLVLDSDFYFTNGSYGEQWPAKLPTYRPGQPLERTVQVFNDELDGDELFLRWSLHWDNPQGPWLEGKEKRLKIKPGFHVAETIQAQIPATQPKEARKLYLVLESLKGGRLRFHDESVSFLVPPTAW